MTKITSIEVTDDKITFYVPSNELPNTDYVNQQLRQVLDTKCEGSFIDFILYVRKNRVLPISFTYEDYCDLAEHVKEHFRYNLRQARIIIRWIESNVVERDDGCDYDCAWSTTFLEILEGACERDAR